MSSQATKNLIFLERQFNTLKSLIPTVNDLASRSSAPERIIKRYFRFSSGNWDTLKSEDLMKAMAMNLSAEEEALLSSHINQALTHFSMSL